MKQRAIQVVCLVRRGGAPDFVQYTLQVSGDEVEQGLHYVLAKQRAREAGLEVVDAFDQEDPAYQWLTVGGRV